MDCYLFSICGILQVVNGLFIKALLIQVILLEFSISHLSIMELPTTKLVTLKDEILFMYMSTFLGVEVNKTQQNSIGTFYVYIVSFLTVSD